MLATVLLFSLSVIAGLFWVVNDNNKLLEDLHDTEGNPTTHCRDRYYHPFGWDSSLLEAKATEAANSPGRRGEALPAVIRRDKGNDPDVYFRGAIGGNGNHARPRSVLQASTNQKECSALSYSSSSSGFLFGISGRMTGATIRILIVIHLDRVKVLNFFSTGDENNGKSKGPGL